MLAVGLPPTIPEDASSRLRPGLADQDHVEDGARLSQKQAALTLIAVLSIHSASSMGSKMVMRIRRRGRLQGRWGGGEVDGYDALPVD